MRSLPSRKAASTRSRWFCDLLPWIASAAKPAFCNPRTTLSAPCLVRVKTSTRSTVSVLSTSASRACLEALSVRMIRWSTFSTVVACGVTATRAGSRNIWSASRVISCGMVAEKNSVCRLLAQHGDDPLDVMDEAHVEHAVGFVQHQHLDLVEAQRALVDEIDQAAGRGHEHFDAVRQRAHLPVDRHAADGQCNRERADVAPVGAEAVGDLAGQFARRREHQHAAGFFRRPQTLVLQVMEDRQRESRGFAGSGLRDADDIAALQGERDGLGLDRRGGKVFLFGECAKDRLSEAEVVK